MSAVAEPLPKSMPAVVAHGPGDYRFEDRPVPKPGPGEVVIKVKSAGICASDIKCFTGAPMFWGDEHRTGYCQPPVTPGHEFVGEVVALGAGAGEIGIEADLNAKGVKLAGKIEQPKSPG